MADELHDECGVFGIYGDNQAALKSYWGTFSLQHRGQESAGLAVLQGEEITVHKGMGLVTEALKIEEESQRTGHAAIGHVRYSTTGESSIVNAQPLLMKTRFGLLALGQNGNLVNAQELRQRLEAEGAIFQGTTDSEVLAHLIARSHQTSFYEALRDSLQQLQGGFAFTVLTDDALYGARDPHGIRPLALGQTEDGAYLLASESCAFDVIGARYIREIDPGELITIRDKTIETDRFVNFQAPRALCSFEMIYFARPDSHMEGQSTHVVRRRLGEILAHEAPAQADLVIGVPDSSIPAAMGYAQAARLPFDFGLVKNRYVARTFIAPNQALRESGVQLKLSAVREVVEGKRLVLVDDSLVRGTTSRHLVQILRHAGATEVHMRIASPPYTDPCHYGIDTSRATELAARNMSIEEIRDMVGADSLAYLSIDGLRRGLSQEGWCMACFGAGYPVPLTNDLNVSVSATKGGPKSHEFR
ncbi:MAG: amidophosphoribosyltransferase [Sulfobacillus thermosulfidooxidans]|uniref:Amidophosphoribosyltransferase n=1 Tax=Sulfobacillus thermosulfidooxidans TaxID=28034 RepID=A0A2T2X156_SULTH|nr:MAG: amidophosphoribosyltransferase [Sulfobacillus thermosulfidooxidans]